MKRSTLPADGTGEAAVDGCMCLGGWRIVLRKNDPVRTGRPAADANGCSWGFEPLANYYLAIELSWEAVRQAGQECSTMAWLFIAR